MGPFRLVLGHEESHGGLGDGEILAGRGHALGVIGLEQGLGGPLPQDEGQLPGRVLGVVDAGVQPPGPKRRHEVGTVASQQDPPGLHALGLTAVEGVERLPDDRIVGIWPNDGPDPCVERARASSSSRSTSSGTCQSIRNTEPGRGWISTCRPGFHDGSK